jgi:hypothetical protein
VHGFVLKKRKSALLTLLSALKEELIWRVVLCYCLKWIITEKYLIIIVGSAMFTISHWTYDRPIVMRAQAELLIFSVILYSLYIFTLDVCSVWTMHILRNLSIKAIKNQDRHE